MTTLSLRGKDVSLEEGLDDNNNILHQLGYAQKHKDFSSQLVSLKTEIEATVTFHLRARCCELGDKAKWMFGSYNVCIPVCINSLSDNHPLVRIPLVPFMIGEENNPGNMDKKLRSEAATYIWIHKHCPSVPIPSL
ncbi:hypothetical protein GX50_07696 [[Emmonsia] crescens]|uniref:Uncharacterized protein n=1 Tax=[Emmonsia] crescens TaxID=73230 RepID=A0A2B7YZL9_9EURO|nr:hypothetical protein GX50_07696 [Emmonsia crescens]